MHDNDIVVSSRPDAQKCELRKASKYKASEISERQFATDLQQIKDG